MKTSTEKLKSFYLNGVKLNPVDFTSIAEIIKESIEGNKKLIINYANAYSIVEAGKNESLLNSLSLADLVHPDGTGMWLALKILYKEKYIKRFNWTDCGYDFLKICEENKWKIFFLGSTGDIQIKAKKNLKEKYPALKLEGSFNGYEDLNRKDLIEDINKLNVDILYVGLGTPKQEIWISENAGKLNCKVIQAVGDLFNLFAGEKIRGPKLLQRIGLEWLFRLLRNPGKYFRRYIIGIPLFFILAIKEFRIKKS